MAIEKNGANDRNISASLQAYPGSARGTEREREQVLDCRYLSSIILCASFLIRPDVTTKLAHSVAVSRT